MSQAKNRAVRPEWHRISRLFSADLKCDTSQVGVEFIQRWEAFMPEWYLCAANVWTIGYGATESVRGVSRTLLPGPITEVEAARLLRFSLAEIYEPVVESSIRVDLTQCEFDALVSLCYNIGGSAFASSTVVRRLNRRDREGAADAITWWNKASGRVLQGLLNRREAERDMFLKGVYNRVAATPMEVLPVVEVQPDQVQQGR